MRDSETMIIRETIRNRERQRLINNERSTEKTNREAIRGGVTVRDKEAMRDRQTNKDR